MDQQELQTKRGIPFTGFPMKNPEMQIETPPPNPFQPAEESEECRDTQRWD